MQRDTEKPMLLKVDQVAVLLAISRSMAYNLINSGEIPSLRIGAHLRVSRGALEEWIQERTVWGTTTNS